MYSLWKHYDPEDARFERSTPPAYGWSLAPKRDVPRYIRGEDGYWYDPDAVVSDTALLCCTGDLMCEPRMTNAHRYGDAFFFHPLFRYVRDVLHRADFCVANLETTLSDRAPYAGDYHCIATKYHCNAPACYLDAVRYAGFDALVTANNHNCDAGIGGLYDTLHTIDNYGFMRTGSFLPNETERVLLVRICGFRVAILSYGNRYNDLDERHFTEEGIRHSLNYFSKETCRRDVAYAREHGAEFILCYQHWGVDYDEQPNEKQLRILEDLKGCGVDYVVGSHTHCLQHFDLVEAEDGTLLPLTFSMGNFVTNERKELCKHTGILQLILRRTTSGVTAEEYVIPCYVFDEFGTGRFCVVPTDGQLNGGYTHERMPAINEYLRGRIGNRVPFLPSGARTLHELCAVMGAETTLPDRPVTRLCLGSTDLINGALYFTLKPRELADNRRVLAQNAVIVATEPHATLPTVVVEDVAAAYRAAQASLRPLADGLVHVAVAGAEGKTVTRELIARALRTKGGVLTVTDAEHITTDPWQEVHPCHRFCVTELRADHPLGLREAAALARPDHVVVTAAPCDVAALAAALPAGGTLYYNETDDALVAAVTAIDRADITITPYGANPCSCSLPFDCLAPATEVASLLSDGAVDAIATYTRKWYTQSIQTVDGVTLVLNMSAATTRSAESALRAVPTEGRLIAVLGSPTYGEYAPAFLQALEERAAVLLTVDEQHTLTDAENTLLTTLRDGDVLFLCGGREHALCELVRRLFGITDGFIPDAS